MRKHFTSPVYHPLIDVLERQLFDWSYHPTLRATVSCGLFCCSNIARIRNPCRAFYLLLTAHRLVKRGFWAKVEVPVIRKWCRIWYQRCGSTFASQEVSPTDLRLFKVRSLVLKAPVCRDDEVEKGVLLVAGHFRELICLLDVEKLLKDYWLVLEPGSAGYAEPSILYLANFPQHPILVMSPAVEDRRFLSELGSNLIPIDLGASDWVNPAIFRPLPDVNKEYDAIMVAYWGRLKRHHVLFRAMRALRDKTFRVALVGFPWDEGNMEKIRKLASWYGVEEQIDFYEKLEPSGVNEVLNRSKVNLLLSLKEGANRTLFEGMFANVPAILLKNNIGVNKEHIVEGVTGCLVTERELPSRLQWFRAHYMEYSPREWAMKHISPEVSTSRLNAILKDLALSSGEPWTADIVAKCNAPEPMYYPDATVAKKLPKIDEVLQRYGRQRGVGDPM